jgi:hypothetical protein
MAGLLLALQAWSQRREAHTRARVLSLLAEVKGPETLRAAAQEFAPLGIEGIDALIQLMTDGEHRAAARGVLCEIVSPAVPNLIDVLKTHANPARLPAAEVLGANRRSEEV